MMVNRELLRLATPYPRQFALSTFVLMVGTASYLLQALLISFAFTAVVRHDSASATAWFSGIVLLALFRWGVGAWGESLAAKLGLRIRLDLRDRALSAALSPSRLHDQQSRDGVARLTLTEGVEGVDVYLSRYLSHVCQVLLLCPVVLILVAVINPWLALSLLLCVLTAVAAPMLWKRLMLRRGSEHWDSYESLAADFLEVLKGMRTVRVLGASRQVEAKLKKRSDALHRHTVAAMRVSLADTALIDLAIQAGTVIAAAFAVFDAVQGNAPTTAVYLMILLASEVFRPIRELSRQWHAGYLGLSALDGLRTLGVLSSADPKEDAPAAGSGSQPHESPITERGEGVFGSPPSTARPDSREPSLGLQIERLSFGYPGATEPVLKNLHSTIAPGGITALIGGSGAGKSTFFDLVLGFLSPSAGSISFRGRSLKVSDVAVISQRSVLFTGTVRENLLAGRPDSTDQELWRACELAGIFEEVSSWPGGLAATLSESGASISQGQRQRLSIARALVADRPIILADEPTSALNPERAALVLANLQQIARDKVVLMISHRPESLVYASRILRLKDGYLIDADKNLLPAAAQEAPQL